MFRTNKGLSLKQLAEAIAEYNDIDFDKVIGPEEIKKRIDLSGEGNRFVRQLQVGDKSAFLRVYSDMVHVPEETEITTALKQMIVKPPKIAFLNANNERGIRAENPRDYTDRLTFSPDRRTLIDKGFNFIEIASDTAAIPDDVDVLVIADPTKSYDSSQLRRIERYISEGRDLMIAAEPSHKDILRSVTDPLGVRFMEGTLLQDSDVYAPDFMKADVCAVTAKYSERFKKLLEDPRYVISYNAMGLTYNNNGPFKVDPLLTSHQQEYWNHIGEIKPDSIKYIKRPAVKDRVANIPIGLTLTRKINNGDQKIIVLGDADMFSNGAINTIQKKNEGFIRAVFSWFDNGEFPIELTWEKVTDNKITATLDQIFYMRVFFLGILPGIFLITGSVILYIRRRR